MRVLYLGISGTLHPSASTYQLVLGRSPWSDGHTEYEAAPWLAQTLEQWPDVQVVLTSTQPWKHGLPAVSKQLGALAARVIGFTYEDLTTRAVRQVRTRSGTTRKMTYSDEDYWRLHKSEIVRLHIQWLRPVAWIAVDDETILWTEQELQQHLVAVDGCKGLLDPTAQDRLVTVLTGNFGPAKRPQVLAHALSQMPNVGEEEDFGRSAP